MEAEDCYNVLLLAVPPGPPSRKSLSRVLARSFRSGFAALKCPDRSSRLLIVVAGPFMTKCEGGSSQSTSNIWSDLQSTLAGFYSLVSFVCSQESIATDVGAERGGVDARVILVDESFGGGSQGTNSSIIFNLSQVASLFIHWNRVFYPETPRCRELLSKLVKMAPASALDMDGKSQQLVKLEIGDGPLEALPATCKGSKGRGYGAYRLVCLGGTFDHVHPGHKLLLSAASLLLDVSSSTAQSPCRLIVGVTGDKLLKNKKHADYIQPWPVRAGTVLDFLRVFLDWPGQPSWQWRLEESDSGHMTGHFRSGGILVECVEIQDAFGPTITVEDVEVLVVSGETISGGQAVNERRQSMGWKSLDIFEVDVLDASELCDHHDQNDNFASKISSSAIRQERAAASAAASAARTTPSTPCP